MAYWVPTGYSHHGKCIPLCECLGGGRWQDPGCPGPRFAGCLSDPFGVPFGLIFSLGGVSLSGAWGQARRERAGVQWEVREGGRKEAQPRGVMRLRVSAFGFAVTFSVTRVLLGLLPRPCLVTCRGAWAQGGAFLLLGTVRVFHSSAGGDGHWHGSLRPD